jgi:hypothetical protein
VAGLGAGTEGSGREQGNQGKAKKWAHENRVGK